MSEETTQKKDSQEEINIIELFKVIGNGFGNLFRWIGRLIHNVFVLFILILSFLKKYLIFIIIAAILGFVAERIASKYKSEVYEATAVVQTNYEIEFQLRARIQEFNELIINQDSIKLGRLLEIEPSKAAKLISFEIEPIYSINKLRFDYYDYIYEQDSTLQKNFSFNMYEEEMRFEDYDNFEITAHSSENESFSLLNNKLWDFSDSPNITDRRDREMDVLLNKKKLLENSLKSIDSTRSVLRQVLITEANKPQNGAGTNIDLGAKEAYKETPELYSYEKDLSLELVSTIQDINKSKNFVNVIKRFPEYGSPFRIIKSYYLSIAFILLAILIILGIKLFKYLGSVEQNETWKFKKL